MHPLLDRCSNFKAISFAPGPMCSFAPFAVDVVALLPTYTWPKPPFPSFLSTMYTGEPPTCVCFTLKRSLRSDSLVACPSTRLKCGAFSSKHRRHLRKRIIRERETKQNFEISANETHLLWNWRGGTVFVRFRVFAIVRRFFDHLFSRIQTTCFDAIDDSLRVGKKVKRKSRFRKETLKRQAMREKCRSVYSHARGV